MRAQERRFNKKKEMMQKAKEKNVVYKEADISFLIGAIMQFLIEKKMSSMPLLYLGQEIMSRTGLS